MRCVLYGLEILVPVVSKNLKLYYDIQTLPPLPRPKLTITSWDVSFGRVCNRASSFS